MIPHVLHPLIDLFFVAPGPPAPVSTVLDITVEKQKRTNWCWAAVGLAIRRAYLTAGTREQCDIASTVLSAKCCPYGQGCNSTHRLRPALDVHHMATYKQPGHQTIEFVQQEIDAGNPICARIHRRHSGSGHFVIIAGYCVTSISTILWICDPEYGSMQPWMFDGFLNHYLEFGFWHLSFETGQGTVGPQIGGPACH